MVFVNPSSFNVAGPGGVGSRLGSLKEFDSIYYYSLSFCMPVYDWLYFVYRSGWLICSRCICDQCYCKNSKRLVHRYPRVGAYNSDSSAVPVTAKLLLEFAEIAIAIFDSEARSKYTALLFVWHFHVLMMMMTFRGQQ
jgi:hypothetical protein